MIAVLGLAAVGAGAWWFRSKRDVGPKFRTAPVKRGDITATISATGTIEPTVVVDVGSQVNGMIRSFGKDTRGRTIDYASPVDAGTVLANIDDSLYVAALDTAKAQLAQANANKVSADANVLQMKAKLLEAENDWERARKLGPSDALSKTTYDQYQATYEVATANLASAVAAVEQAKASIAQGTAALRTARINLGYCTIKAPVKGVIIDRQVNIGQTVVSSLSATSLFLLAKDLKRITAWVSVNEADVGSIFKGQPVTFTVDAFPGRVFKGEVGKIRLNATMTQNVVTYTVEVNTNNDDGKLLPYLTANAKFITGQKENVLLVPNAALRWSPRQDQTAPEARQKPARTESSKHNHSEGPDTSSRHNWRGGADASSRHNHSGESDTRHGGPDASGETQARGTIWVEQGKSIRPVSVRVGLTDGAFTEIEGKDLSEGMRTVIGEALPGTQAETGSEHNPFVPQSPWGSHQGQGQGGPEGSRGPGGGGR